jgi:ABC-type Fe3+ transport system substrate-binding protein
VPIAHVQPADFAGYRYYYLPVPVNAAHPNAAKLFVATALSAEGQKILFRNGDFDLHTFPDSGMRKVIADYEAQGVRFQEFSVTWWEQHPELEERLAQAIRILTRR